MADLPAALPPLTAPPRLPRWTWPAAAALWLAGFIPLVNLDGPFTQWWKSINGPKIQPWRVLKHIDVLAEPLALVIIAVALTLLLFAQARRAGLDATLARRVAARFVALYVACGVAAAAIPNFIKLVVPRLRPKAFAGDSDLWAAQAYTPDLNAWHSFLYSGQARVPYAFDWDWQSFPSSHTSTAFCVIVAILWTWRRPWVFVVAGLYALLVGMGRVIRLAHYFSDVWTGVFVGLAAGYLACRLADALLRRLEARRPA